jgi:RNA-splicing ligase RtcB
VVTHEEVNCHHNYVSQEFHYGAEVYVTRKGAIRALDGELLRDPLIFRDSNNSKCAGI